MATDDEPQSDTTICRIDVAPGELAARVWPAGSADAADPPSNWVSIAPSDRGLVVGGLGQWMLLGKATLATLEENKTGDSKPVTACPLLGADYTLGEQPELPEAAAATRRAVFDAAMACNFDRLIELGVNTNTTFGGGTLAENWPELLVYLREVGGYIDYRVGINADGTWGFFVAGD